MRVLILAAFVLSVAACGRLSIRTTSDPKPNAHIEQLYSRALAHLDPASDSGAGLDSAAGLLEAYLAHAGPVQRAPEARALLRLTNDARQLVRVETALRRERAAGDTTTAARGDGAPQARDGAALREIERLREQLANANAELERIRKRLAAPKPPGS